MPIIFWYFQSDFARSGVEIGTSLSGLNDLFVCPNAV